MIIAYIKINKLSYVLKYTKLDQFYSLPFRVETPNCVLAPLKEKRCQLPEYVSYLFLQIKEIRKFLFLIIKCIYYNIS